MLQVLRRFRRYNWNFIKNAFLHRFDSIPNVYKVKCQLILPLLCESFHIINNHDIKLHLLSTGIMSYGLYNLYHIPIKLNYKLQLLCELSAKALFFACVLIIYYY